MHQMHDRHIKTRDWNYSVWMRPWEFKVYVVYDELTSVWIGRIFEVCRKFIVNWISKIKRKYLLIRYGTRTNAFGQISPNTEYYLIHGEVKIRKYTGKSGTWRYIDGKPVKIDDDISTLPIPIYNWKETDNGRWDETFKCHVKDKDHYRQLLKSEGLRQKEDYKYCASKEQINRQKMIDARKKVKVDFVKGGKVDAIRC